MIAFTVSDVITGVPPQRVYDAWLDGDAHAAMTGSEYARIEPTVDGTYTVWDDYVWGRNLALEPGRRIVQTWRTTDFATDDPDSQIEVRFEAADGGTRVTIAHTGIPDDQEHYRDGWREYYFEPMKLYFSEEAAAS